MIFYEKEPVSLYLEDMTPIDDINSPKQHIQLFAHPWLGKVLVINGEIQHIEKYQTLYHEMLVHLPTAFVPKIENVLIIGGGSLFAAYEVLKYSSVQHLTLCDYDGSVLELMKKHYAHAATVVSDPRFTFIERDAHQYLKNCVGPFDLIINDCFNLAAESDANNCSYFEILSNLCSPNGVCVDIIYRHVFDSPTTVRTLQYLKQEMRVALSMVVVPEYPGILHLETIWGKSKYISQDLIHPVNYTHLHLSETDVGTMFSFYLPRALPTYLYLPPYIRKMFSL